MTLDELNQQIRKDPALTQMAHDDPDAFEDQVAQLYQQSGFDRYGKAIKPVRKGLTKFSEATGINQGVVDIAAAIPIPAFTTFAGGVLAGITGASGMSIAGEEINSELGITPPMTAGDRVLAGAAPVAGPLISRGKQLINKGLLRLPGTGAGLQELASEIFERGLGKFRVTKEQVDAAFIAMRQAPDFNIKVPALTEAMKNAMERTARTQRYAFNEEYGKRLQLHYDKLIESPTMSFRDFDAMTETFSNLQKSAPTEHWDLIKKAIIEDLKSATVNPKLSAKTRRNASVGLLTFSNAMESLKRYDATDMLDELFRKVSKDIGTDEVLTAFDKKAFRLGLKDPKLTNVYSPAEIKEMSMAVEDLGYIGKMPKPDMPLVGRSGGPAAIGYAVAGQSGALEAFAIHKLFSDAVSSDMGRKIIKYLAVHGKGRINALELQSLMGKVVAGTLAGAAGATPQSRQPSYEELDVYSGKTPLPTGMQSR